MLSTPTIGVSCFFFSSRRRHTRFDCDWSSDVCSSDLLSSSHLLLYCVIFVSLVCESGKKGFEDVYEIRVRLNKVRECSWQRSGCTFKTRSEERRVWKECRSRWSPYH